MSSLAPTVLALLRLRAGPQDLPYSTGLCITSVILYAFVIAVSSTSLASEGEPGRSLLAISLQFIAVVIALRYRGNLGRFVQTAMAFALTGIVLGVLQFMLLSQANPEQNQPLLAVAWFALFGWSLSVDANIFRHALDISLPIAMLITVMLLAFTFIVLELLVKMPAA